MSGGRKYGFKNSLTIELSILVGQPSTTGPYMRPDDHAYSSLGKRAHKEFQPRVLPNAELYGRLGEGNS
jgi:hypothetical protein